MNDRPATELARLADAGYALVTSYRRDGAPVGTALWVVRDGDALGVWTPVDSWKVKRIRRNPAVEVAPCTALGKPLAESVPGHAELLDAAGTERIRDLIRRKYGLSGRLTLLASRLRRGLGGTVGIRIQLRPTR